MKRIFKDFVKALIIVMMINFPANAGVERKSIVEYNAETNTVHVISEINENTIERLYKLHDKVNYDKIVITSPGGDFDSGIMFGEYVRKHNISVTVKQYCNSSCSIIFFNAHPRHRKMLNGSVLGLHNVSIESNVRNTDDTYVSVRQLTRFSEEIAAKVGYLFTLYAANGIPPETLYQISLVRGRDVVTITSLDLVRWGSMYD